MSTSGTVKVLNSASDSWPTDIKYDAVWIFSENIETSLAVSKNMPNNVKSMPVGEAINRIAGRIAPEIVNIDQKLVRGPFYNSWLASSLSEPNPYRSDFVLNICQTIAIIEAALQGGQHIVLVDDLDFGNVLTQALRDNKIQASWYGPLGKASGSFGLKIIRAFLSALKSATEQVSAGKKWLQKNTNKTDAIYLLNWVKADTFSSNEPQAVDANFGVLPQWIREIGETPHWIGNPISWINPLASIIANTSNAYDYVIPIPALLKYRDIFQAVLGWALFPLAVNTRLNIGKFDVSAIVKLYVRKELMSSQIIRTRLLINFAKYLKQQQTTPKILVYTYENQPWEKILLASFRRHLPDTKLIGVQHAPFSDRYLSVYPGKRQWQEGTTPDLLVAIGPNSQQQFGKYGTPTDRVVVGGSLRMPHLADNQPYKPYSSAGDSADKFKRILVTCPIGKNHAIELAVKSVCATQNITNVEMTINFHPAGSPDLEIAVRNTVRDLTVHDHVNFSNESVLFWLEKTDLLLYDSSATVFDATRRGVPTLYIGPLNGLDIDKYPKSETQICRTIEDINIAIDQVFTHPLVANEVAEERQNSLNLHFSKPDKIKWKTFLSENSDARNDGKQ